MKRLVIEEHRRSYSDPIALQKGETLKLSGREEIWDGHKWLWAQSGDGREGWIPDELAVRDGNRMIAAYDYSALELSVTPGEIVNAVRETHGWVWCRKESGEVGWLPTQVLEKPEASPSPALTS